MRSKTVDLFGSDEEDDDDTNVNIYRLLLIVPSPEKYTLSMPSGRFPSGYG